MKKIIILFFILLIKINLFCQSGFGLASSCNLNLNGSNTNDILSKATFKIIGLDGLCTGTLINQDVSSRQLKFYFVTAGHCMTNFDPDYEYEFAFNYQSPTSANEDVPLSNRDLRQNPFQSTRTNHDGLQYYHKSKIRRIHREKRGFIDFALCEILTPIPVHYNIAFAGWNPTKIRALDRLAVAHHSKGDIKKQSFGYFTTGTIKPINSACRIGMKVGDLVLGWIWRKKWSSEVICNVFNYLTPTNVQYETGKGENGASGASLMDVKPFNSSIIATLNSEGLGSPISCAKGNIYTLFNINYHHQAVRSVLNPEFEWLIDQFGIASREVKCYDKLDNLKGEYFAARDYQAENKIDLRATGLAELKQGETIRIHPGADYAFFASQFSMGFETQIERVAPRSGTNEIAGEFMVRRSSDACLEQRQDGNKAIPQEFQDRLNNLKLPSYKPLNLNIVSNSSENIQINTEQELSIYPNPSSNGNIAIRFTTNSEKNVDFIVRDMLGRTIHSSKIKCIQGENYHQLNLENYQLKSGIYLIAIVDGENNNVAKVAKVVIGN